MNVQSDSPKLKRSWLAQLLLDGLLAVPEAGAAGKAVSRTLNLLRRTIARAWDPLVTYELEGRRILLPLSHNLPVARKRSPDYSSNLGRIAAAIAQAYPNAVAIDIGANIGDSAAIIRAKCPMPILSVEADAKFLGILAMNLPKIGDEIDVFAGFVGDNRGRLEGELVAHDGTARLVRGRMRASVDARPLGDIVEKFPKYRCAKLLKLDTDGFDLAILRGAMSFVERARPILFFEYDPYYLDLVGDDGLRTLADLQRLGYANALIYDNFGDLLIGMELSNWAIFEDLQAYYSGRAAQRYMDVCLFPEQDGDLYRSIHRAERAYFAERRAFAERKSTRASAPA